MASSFFQRIHQHVDQESKQQQQQEQQEKQVKNNNNNNNNNNNSSNNNPLLTFFNMMDVIPKNIQETLNQIDWKKELFSLNQHDALHILKLFIRHQKFISSSSSSSSSSNLLHYQYAHDVITGQNIDYDSDIQQFVKKCVHMAYLAYSLPYFIPYFLQTLFSPSLSSTNAYLLMQATLEKYHFASIQYMIHTLYDPQDISPIIPLSRQDMAGFFIRTPLRVWDNQWQLTSIPSWSHRHQLCDEPYSHWFWCGNNVAYIFRVRHRIWISFRGTADDFNAANQYGKHMQKTQVYRKPDFQPLTREFFVNDEKTNENNTSLFFSNYVFQVEDLLPHLIQSLEWLDALNDQKCHDIVVTGHSMGGALVLIFQYLLYHHYPKIYQKCKFVAFGAPMCANSAAIMELEKYASESNIKNKHVEILNTDDFVVIPYQMGQDPDAIRHCIANGKHMVGSFLLSHILQSKHDFSSSSSFSFLKDKPEFYLAIFLYGMLQKQAMLPCHDSNVACRMGNRKDEMKQWGSSALSKQYQKSVRLLYYHRQINEKEEFLGRSHAFYIQTNMIPLWQSSRRYEDQWYQSQSENKNKNQEKNKLLFIPFLHLSTNNNNKNHINKEQPVKKIIAQYQKMYQAQKQFVPPYLPFGIPATKYQHAMPPTSHS